MNKRQIIITSTLSTAMTFTLLISLLLLFTQVKAAATPHPQVTITSQTISSTMQYVSISGLTFNPGDPTVAYTKDVQTQLLKLGGPANPTSNLFVAPVTLPDRSQLMGVTMFGEDYDPTGEIRLKLKRCNHGQPFCVIIAETSSTRSYTSGQFETSRVNVINEVVDNRFYTYFLALNITALNRSGLRSVRLEYLTNSTSPAVSSQKPWSLTGNIRIFTVPTSGFNQVKICPNNLSHLNNSTHYPYVVADGQITSLSSNSCVTVWGQSLTIEKSRNTGSSSGTYQILQ